MTSAVQRLALELTARAQAAEKAMLAARADRDTVLTVVQDALEQLLPRTAPSRPTCEARTPEVPAVAIVEGGPDLLLQPGGAVDRGPPGAPVLAVVRTPTLQEHCNQVWQSICGVCK